MPPLLIAVDLLQSSPPIESSLHLMSLPLVLIRHRSMDLADHPGLGPLHMTARTQEMPSAVTLASVAVRMNATWSGSFLAMLLATEEGPFSGIPFSQTSRLFAQVTFASPEAARFTEVTFATTETIRFKRVTLSKANAIRF